MIGDDQSHLQTVTKDYINWKNERLLVSKVQTPNPNKKKYPHSLFLCKPMSRNIYTPILHDLPHGKYRENLNLQLHGTIVLKMIFEARAHDMVVHAGIVSFLIFHLLIKK